MKITNIEPYIFMWVDGDVHLVIAFCFLKQDVAYGKSGNRKELHMATSMAYDVRFRGVLFSKDSFFSCHLKISLFLNEKVHLTENQTHFTRI